MGHGVKRKKNPIIKKDAAWSGFDKAPMNRIKTTWASESPMESSPACLRQLQRVGKVKPQAGSVKLISLLWLGLGICLKDADPEFRACRQLDFSTPAIVCDVE